MGEENPNAMFTPRNDLVMSCGNEKKTQQTSHGSRPSLQRYKIGDQEMVNAIGRQDLG
jgi:hypothetical protein